MAVAAQFGIDRLETRALLSAITLGTDAGSNAIYLDRSGDTDQIFENQPLTGTPLMSFPAADNDSVEMYDGTGNNTITVDYSGGDPISGGLDIEPTGTTSATADTINIVNTQGADYTLSKSQISYRFFVDYSTDIQVATSLGYSDDIEISSDTSYQNAETTLVAPNLNLIDPGTTNEINVASGSFTFNSDLGTGSASTSMSVANGSSVAFGVTQHLASLNISSGASVSILPAGGQILDTDTLSVGGKLDLTNNDLIVNDPSSLASLENAVAAGDLADLQDESLPQGSIGSSTAYGDGMFVGYAPESVVNLGTLDGQTIQSGGLAARYTLQADFNLDGIVNDTDFGILEQNFGHTLGTNPPQWYEGDADLNGIVNISDFGILAEEFGNGALSSPTAVDVDTPYVIDLPTTTPSGDTILRWDLNWGDGDVDSYQPGTIPGTDTPVTAQHTYTSPGIVAVQMSALTASGTVYQAPATALSINASGSLTAVNLTALATNDAFAITSDTSGDTTITETDAAGDLVDYYTYGTASLLSINISGDTGGTLDVDFTNSDPLPTSGVFADSGTLDISGSTGADTLFTTSTAAVFGNAEMRHPASTAVTFLNAGAGDQIVALAGTVTIAGDTSNDGQGSNNGGPSIFVNTAATVLFTGTQHLSELNILPAGTARMTADGTAVLVTDGLNISDQTSIFSGGVLDLADNDLIVHGGNLTDVANWLSNGYDGGLWDDNSNWPSIEPAAIDSSTALNDDVDSNGIEALGYAQVGTGQGNLPLTAFDNQTVNNGDVLVKFTYYGDADLDGTVDSTDETIVNNGIANQLTGWSNGDFFYSGSIDGSDAAVVDNMETATLLPQSITLAADSNFPVSDLPTTLPDGVTPISSWQINLGNGDIQAYNSTDPEADSVVRPYTDADGSYLASLVALDSNGNPEFQYPHININVSYVAPPTAPTGLTANAVSSSEIDLSWTDQSAATASDIIYESADNGTTFDPIDQISSTGIGSANSYQATGLSPGSNYEFYIATDDGYTMSVESNMITAAPLLPSTTAVIYYLSSQSSGTPQWTQYSGVNNPITVYANRAVTVDSLGNINTTNASESILQTTYRWDFGDTNTSQQDTFSGWNSAHVYQQAGTYPLSLTITTSDGTTSMAELQVTVLADTRTSIYISNEGSAGNSGLTPAQSVPLSTALSRLMSNTRLLFEEGDSFNITSSLVINLGTDHDIMIGSYQNGSSGSTAPPVLSSSYLSTDISSAVITNAAEETGTSSLNNILVQGIEFSSDNSNDEQVSIEVEGTNYAIIGCVFDYVNYAVKGDGNPGPTGILVQGNTSPLYHAINQYFVFTDASSYWTIVNNIDNEPDSQHCIRVDANAGTETSHLSIEYNNLTNYNKGTCQIDSASFAYVANNITYGSGVRVGPLGEFAGEDPSVWVVVEDNTLSTYNTTSSSNPLALSGPVSHYVARNNILIATNPLSGVSVYGPPAPECITLITNYQQCTDITFIDNTGIITGNTQGDFLDIHQENSASDNYVTDLNLVNNLFVAPDLELGPYETGEDAAIILDGTNPFAAFTSLSGSVIGVRGNVWPNDIPAKGLTYMPVVRTLSGSSYVFDNLATWNSSVSSNDIVESVTFVSGTYEPTPTSQAATYDTAFSDINGPIYVPYDFNGNLRSPTGTQSAGAIEVNPVTTLNLTGTQTNDTIYLRKDTISNSVDVWQNATINGVPTGSPTGTYSFAIYTQIIITGSAGGETVTVDWTDGTPLPVNGLIVNASTLATSSNSLNIILSNSLNNVITSTSNQLAVNGSIATFSNESIISLTPNGGLPDSLTIGGGTLTIPANPVGGGIVTDNFSLVSIAAGGRLQVANPKTNHTDRSLLIVNSLSVANDGILDMGGNDMIVRSANTNDGFTDGNGTSDYDQYPGKIGNGWSSVWTPESENDTITSTTVASASPLNGNGNYLSYSDTSDNNDGPYLGGISRQYSTSGYGVNTGSSYTITFDYRLDAGLQNFTSQYDRIAIFGDSGASDGTEPNNTWDVSVYGPHYNNLRALDWGVQANSSQGFVDSGIALNTGTVYHFVINVNPQTSTYDASISANGYTTYYSPQFPFRTNMPFTSSTNTYINFTDRHGSMNTTTAWSLDSIVISNTTQVVSNLATSGINIGNWNGISGIDSSAAETDTTHTTAIGIISNGGADGQIYSSFDGQVVYATDVLLKYTYYGDANLDGKVDGSDYSRIDNGYLNQASGWSNGDFNYDGIVDGLDYNLIDNVFNTQGPQL